MILVFWLGILLMGVKTLGDSPSVQAYRAQLRVQSEKMVSEHNQKKASYQMRLYQRFAALTSQEMSELLAMPMPIGLSKIRVTSRVVRSSDSGYDIDWRRKNKSLRGSDGKNRKISVLGTVKNQGMCGACYSYAAISDIETSYLFHKKEIDLSEQHVTDCSLNFGNSGCSGGWMGHVFAFAMLHGLHSEAKYPESKWSWLSGTTPECQNEAKGQFRIRRYDFTSYQTNDCLALGMVLQHRPVTAPIAITKQFFFYGSGVLDTCGEEFNHGVVIAGMRQTRDDNYWLVKNSWGTEWGEDGYVRIDRSQEGGNLCRICFAPVYSVV